MVLKWSQEHSNPIDILQKQSQFASSYEGK